MTLEGILEGRVGVIRKVRSIREPLASSQMVFFLSCFLCPPGLQFEGPEAPIYEASPLPRPFFHLASLPTSASLMVAGLGF